MQAWDVIVVGAGPAGCAAAYDLATSGRSVLLLDRCDFPRPKACGGGVTVKAVRALRYSITPVVVATVCRIQVSKNLEHFANLDSTKPVCVMTVREDLDAFCLNQTIGAGAEFQRTGQIHEVSELPDSVVLSTAEGDLQARFLIGADGANSQVRRLMSDATWFRAGFALEAQVASSHHASGMHLDFGVVRDGYGWVFPKDGHLNVGLYSESQQQKITRSTLAEYIQKKLGTPKFYGVIGQHLGMGGRGNRHGHRRVLLVGDAAGLVDPLTGEGIYHAIVSGQAAARAVNSELTECGRAIETFQTELREVQLDLGLSNRAAKRFYANLDWGYAALTSPLVRSVALRTYLQGLTFVRALKRYSFIAPYLSPTRDSRFSSSGSDVTDNRMG
jgi:geranylgeranyl reductase family protein